MSHDAAQDRPRAQTALLGSRVAIVGAGPAGLIAAHRLASAGVAVTVFDKMPSVGRKFLMAGRGGLNLTHSDKPHAFLSRYRNASAPLSAHIRAFSPERLRRWAAALGQETFVGSSGRVFPIAMKASPLLRAWLARLGVLGVEIRTRHTWVGWNEAGALVFETPGGQATFTADATVLALGGASWPRLGSDGAWVEILRAHNVAVTPLSPANCGMEIAWSAAFIEKHAGAPVKPIALTFAGRRVRGEAVVTQFGLEGGAVYALSGPLRDGLAQADKVTLEVDLKPDMALHDVEGRLARASRKETLTNRLRKALSLSTVAIGLAREAGALPDTAPGLARRIKACPIQVAAARPIDRAISSAGGIAWSELTADLMLKKRPSVFAAGEMIDWEAPTGGYLLQACFSTGVAAANGVRAFLSGPDRRPDDRSHNLVVRSPADP